MTTRTTRTIRDVVPPRVLTKEMLLNRHITNERARYVFNKWFLLPVSEFWQQDGVVTIGQEEGQDTTLNQRERFIVMLFQDREGRIWGRTAEDEHYICIGRDEGDMFDVYCSEFQINIEQGRELPYWTPRPVVV